VYYDKIVIENPEKGENIKVNFLHEFPCNRWFKGGIYSLLSRTEARGSADMIYLI